MSTLEQQEQDGETINNGCIVVVAKCPIPGKSKTRLVPLLGEGGSSELAKAMLSDVLLTLEHCPDLDQVTKVLLYAPGDETGLSIMKDILKDIGIEESATITASGMQEFQIEFEACDGTEEIIRTSTSSSSIIRNSGWRLLPMVSPNLQSSDLGDILQHALDRVVDAPWNHNHQEQEPTMGSHGVVFLGMDSPELPLADICKGLQLASKNVGGDRPAALLCPCDDGGYGMLCVPSTSINKGVFQNVYWSHSLTAVSQLKALTDASVPVVLGRLMHDIDEPEDVHKLRKRLACKTDGDKNATLRMGLERYSSHGESRNGMTNEEATTKKVESEHEECKYTKLALEELGLLV